MPILILILIAAVQGITEFLPISSSGHLILMPLITDQPYQGRTIDVAAHVGTFVAVTAYLRKDLLRMFNGMFSLGRRNPNDGHLALLIVLATIPVLIVGFFINKVNPLC